MDGVLLGCIQAARHAPWRTMTPVESLARKNLLTASSTVTVRDAVRQMAERGVGAILVVDDGKLVGIFSERDALRRVLAQGRDPDATHLREVATPEPMTVQPDSPIRECAELVKSRGVRHVPVVDRTGRPVGIVSSRDFLSYIVDELESLIEKANLELRREELTDPYGLI